MSNIDAIAYMEWDIMEHLTWLVGRRYGVNPNHDTCPKHARQAYHAALRDRVFQNGPCPLVYDDNSVTIIIDTETKRYFIDCKTPYRPSLTKTVKLSRGGLLRHDENSFPIEVTPHLANLAITFIEILAREDKP